MREIWPFLKALIHIWWALMSCAAFTILGLYAIASHRPEVWLFWASVALAALMLFVACYVAWRKEYLANTSGPEIVLNWNIGIPHQRQETIEFQNVGSQRAIDVVPEEFSWSDLFWHTPIEIPAIDAHDSKSVPASFYRKLKDSALESGYLRHLLKSGDQPELSLWVRYRNLAGMRFRRRFVLRFVNTGTGPAISCSPAELQIKRRLWS